MQDGRGDGLFNLLPVTQQVSGRAESGVQLPRAEVQSLTR